MFNNNNNNNNNDCVLVALIAVSKMQLYKIRLKANEGASGAAILFTHGLGAQHHSQLVLAVSRFQGGRKTLGVRLRLTWQ